MPRPRLTITEARDLDFQDLVDRMDSLIAPYEAGENETKAGRDVRIGKTLDELPDIYGWLLTLESFFDHWADAMASQGGTGVKNTQYKSYRQRRDACERAARAAKLRYDGASRRLTQIYGEREAASIPRGRG